MSFAVAASRLSNPFIGELPKRIEARIKPPPPASSSTIAAAAGNDFTCLAFNDRGSYLACGTQSGDLVVIDMSTLAPAARVPQLHEREITSISWVKCGQGRQICTVSGEARTVRVYCLEQARVVSEVSFTNRDVYDASIHPSDPNVCLVSLEDKLTVPWPATYSTLDNTRIHEFCPPGDHHTRTAKLVGVCATFSLHGVLVFVGGVGNCIHAFHTSTGAHMQTFLADSTKGKNAWSSHLTLSRNGRELCLFGPTKMISVFDVCSDRFAGGEDKDHVPADASLEQIQDALKWRAGRPVRFRRHVYDLVSNTKWNDICCSGSTGEFVLAVNAQKDLHELNVWDSTSGRLLEVLKADTEPGQAKVFGFATACVWHPYRAQVATLDGNGHVCLWGNQPQASKKFSTTAASSTDDKSWLAFVPEFVEIEENEIYVPGGEQQTSSREQENRRIVEDEECEVDVLDMGFLPQNGTSSDNEDSEDDDDDEGSERMRAAPRRVTRGIGYFIPVRPGQHIQQQ